MVLERSAPASGSNPMLREKLGQAALESAPRKASAKLIEKLFHAYALWMPGDETSHLIEFFG